MASPRPALLLLAGLAASQLTLMGRSSPGAIDYTLMAAMTWLGGGVLLLDHAEAQPSGPAASRPAFALGVLALIWCLLVLSNSARLYDPLLHLFPLAGLLGLALVEGVRPRDRLFRQLTLLGLLPPLMLLNHAFGPSGPLSLVTAQLAAFLIWLSGHPAVAEGITIQLPRMVLEVGAGCTGLNTISLCLAAVLVFALLFPVHSLRLNLALAAGAVLIAFSLNALRVALLGFTSTSPGTAPFGRSSSFDFWHTGGGSHLFSLLAMGGVCGLYLVSLLWKLRQHQAQQR